MAAIDNLMAELDERRLARLIGAPHDNARVRYTLRKNTVDSFDKYAEVLGNYYNHHFSTCVSPGGTLTRAEAVGRAKGIIEREYRRRNGDIVSAYNDAESGTNGGMRSQLDLVCEALKGDSIDHVVRQAFDTFVRPNAWPEKVTIIRQVISRFGTMLGPSIQADQAERYAHDYRNLVQSLVQALQRTSSMFRRL